MAAVLELPTMTPPQAKAMVRRINKAAQEVHVAATRWYLLLVEAHRAQIHVTLGYDSWEKFAFEELGMSSANAYRALDRGKVAEELAKLGVPDPAALVSDRQAAELVRNPKATEQIGAAIASGVPAKRAIAQVAKQAKAERAPAPPEVPESSDENEAVLHAIIAELAATPIEQAAAIYTAAEMRSLAQWAAAVHAKLVDGLRTGPGSRLPAPGKASREEARPDPKSCPHPVSRKLGDKCGLCGGSLAAKAGKR